MSAVHRDESLIWVILLTGWIWIWFWAWYWTDWRFSVVSPKRIESISMMIIDSIHLWISHFLETDINLLSVSLQISMIKEFKIRLLQQQWCNITAKMMQQQCCSNDSTTVMLQQFATVLPLVYFCLFYETHPHWLIWFWLIWVAFTKDNCENSFVDFDISTCDWTYGVIERTKIVIRAWLSVTDASSVSRLTISVSKIRSFGVNLWLNRCVSVLKTWER